MKASNILLLPGWQNSGPDHWQSLWEARHGYHRVEQHDWMRPLRGDWSARLEETVVDADGPVVLVAHSLGCILTAWWAAHSPNAHRVQGRAAGGAPAMWSAPIWPRKSTAGRPLRASRCRFLPCWWAAATTRIAAYERARRRWARLGRALHRLRRRGHINADSGLASWPEGHHLLHTLDERLKTWSPKNPRASAADSKPCWAPRWPKRPEKAQAADAGLPSSLRLDDMVPGMYQPRTRMDEGALYELAESIKAQGIMQPILVRRLAEGDNAGKYEIIAGERRFRAARLAGLDSVPVLVRDVPNEAAAAMALIENIQREDLNPLEEAQGLQRLVKEFGLTHEQAAQAVGRSRSAASNLLRLLNLAEPVQTMLMAGDIDMGHARALLALDRAAQITAATRSPPRKSRCARPRPGQKDRRRVQPGGHAQTQKGKVARPQAGGRRTVGPAHGRGGSACEKARQAQRPHGRHGRAVHPVRLAGSPERADRPAARGKGQVVASDYGLSPEILFSNSNASGMGGMLGALIGGRDGRAVANFTGNIQTKEASAMLTLVDNRSGVQVAAAEGSASKTDLNLFGGLSGNSGGAALGGYTNTAQGKVIAGAFMDAFNQMVRSLRNYKAQTVQGQGLGGGGRLNVDGAAPPSQTYVPVEKPAAASPKTRPKPRATPAKKTSP
jgi:ParB family chromosome partitioning protein